jgi:hypothetical protein
MGKPDDNDADDDQNYEYVPPERLWVECGACGATHEYPTALHSSPCVACGQLVDVKTRCEEHRFLHKTFDEIMSCRDDELIEMFTTELEILHDALVSGRKLEADHLARLTIKLQTLRARRESSSN